LRQKPLANAANQSKHDTPGVNRRLDRAEEDMEHGDTREPIEKEVRFLVPIEKGDTPQRVTYGVVLEPDSEDLQGDVMTAEDIEKAAYGWMERSQQGGHMHVSPVEGAKVVESYIAPCDIPVETTDGTETIKKGSWVLAMRWPPEIWEGIQKGRLTGYSVGGTGVREEIEKHGTHDQSEHGNWARGGYHGDPARDGAAAEGGGTPADQGAGAARGSEHKAVAEGQTAYDRYMRGGASKVTDMDDGPARAMAGMHGRPFTFSPGAQAFLASGDMRAARNITPVWMLAHGKAPIPNYESTAHDEYFVKVKFKDGATGIVSSSRLGVPENYRDAAPEYQEALRGAGVLKPVKKHGHHDQSTHGNWAQGGARERDDAGGTYEKGDVVRLKEDGGVGRIVDYEPGKDGSPDEYAVAPEDLGEDGPNAIWMREDELEAADDHALDGYPSGTVDDEEMYPTGGKWQGEDDAEAEEAEWRAGYGRDASQGWEADAGYQTFTRGQKVRTPTGKIRTVHSQRGAQVFVEEESNGWYHPSKLWPVKKSAEEEALADAVREGLRDAVAKHGSHDQSSHGNWARGGSQSTGDEEDVDLLDLYEESRGATVTLDGHAYTIREIKPFRHVPGLDSVTLEPKDKNSAWYRAERAKLHDDWDLEVSDPERLVELAQQLPGWSRLEGVSKHGSGDQVPHGNWARSKELGMVSIPVDDHSSPRQEDEERDEELRRFRPTHTTRDGVVIEDQPKVQRIRNSEIFASADGRVQLNYGEWKWLAAGQSRGAARPPKLHERGRWGAWPRGADRDDINSVVWSNGSQTLAEFINSLDPGEYDLAT